MPRSERLAASGDVFLDRHVLIPEANDLSRAAILYADGRLLRRAWSTPRLVDFLALASARYSTLCHRRLRSVQ